MNVYLDTQSSSHSYSFAKDFALIFSGALFLALLSRCSFYLWFTLVPVSLESLGVLLLGAFLGPRRGSSAVLSFLVAGTIGLPVFACANFGLTIIGPTAGYLLGFVLAAYLVGYLIEKKMPVTFVFVLGLSLILFTGFLRLITLIGVKQAFILGVCPFLIGEGAKLCIASLLYKLSTGRKEGHTV